jgi:O-antigen ligase
MPLVRFFLYLYALHAGLGVETPLINFAGNFGIGDLGLILIVIAMTAAGRAMQLSGAVIVALVLGILSALSWALAPALGVDNFHPDAWGFVLRWFSYAALLMVLPIVVRERRTLWQCLALFATGTCAQLVLAWLVWRQDPRFQLFNIPLLASDVFNANSIGFYLTLGVPVLLALMVRIRGWKRWLVLLPSLLASVVSAFFTSSKATWATVALIGLAALFVQCVRRPLLAVTVLAIAAGSVGVVSQFEVAQDAAAVLETRWAASRGSNLQRLEMIEAAAQMAQDYPILGAGPKSYQVLGAQYGRLERDPHNAYVGLAAEIGILGALAFVIAFAVLLPQYLFAIYRRGRAYAPELIAFGGALIAVLLQSFVTGLPASDKAAWLLLGLAAVAARPPESPDRTHRS